jgi:hypothetical protein
MFKKLEEINLSELKKNHARLYYFGLGFIQLKIDETWRLHFYTPKLPPITKEEPHNHRYDFTSRILLGELTQTFYDYVDGDSHLIVNESCDPDREAPKLDQPCRIVELDTVSCLAGAAYHLKHTEFHVVKTKSDTITLLERGPYEKEFAHIILPKGQEKVCPFSKKVPDEDLWKIMEDMLHASQGK